MYLLATYILISNLCTYQQCIVFQFTVIQSPDNFCNLFKYFSILQFIIIQLLLVAIDIVLFLYCLVFINNSNYFRLPSNLNNSVSFFMCVCMHACVCVCVCVRICASIFLLTCIIILFNADVNQLPGSASPHSYSRLLVLQFYF